MTQLSDRIERELSSKAGISAAVDERDGVFVLSGLIESEEQRQAAFDIVNAIVPDAEIVDDLDLETVLPESVEGLSVEGLDIATSIGEEMDSTEGTSDNEALEPGDFSDQRTLNDAFGAAGPSGTTSDEDISEGEEVYVPPVDPAMDGDRVVGGFAASSMDSVEPVRSSDGEIGDEAIASAVRRELREDSATNGLTVHVHVENGVVRLTGVVQDVLDVENAEEVAARVTGVVEVIEELEVRSGAF